MTKVELVVSCLLFVFHKELKGLGFKIQHEMNCPP